MWIDDLSSDTNLAEGGDAPTALPERGPRIRQMTARQIECVIARNHVGRVAFTSAGRIEIVPVHYVYADGLLYGRTSSGAKHGAWRARPEVVVEIDEIEGLASWRSVIVRGALMVLDPRGPRSEPFAYWNAVAAIRTLVPAAFTERDPMPQRSNVFRIAPSELTGREAVLRSGR